MMIALEIVGGLLLYLGFGILVGKAIKHSNKGY